MKKLKKPSPEHVKPKDKSTDYTGESAPERVLWINLYFIKYGTNDKFQGAAIFFSLLMIFLMLIMVIIGCFKCESQAWAEKFIGWLQTMLVFTVGIGIGKSISSIKEDAP